MMKKNKKRLKLRKQWAILATIIICFTLIISYAFANTVPTFEINNEGSTQTDTVSRGQELTYNIHLTNEKEYNSVQFSIIYDANALEYVSNSIAKNDDGVDYDIARHTKISDGKINWTFMFADSYQNNDANFGTITFRVKDNAAGNADIKLENITMQRDDFDDLLDPSKVIKYDTNITNKNIFVNVPVDITSINVTKKIELDLGSDIKSQKIEVSYLPLNTTDNKTFTYTSEDENIAVVDNDGVVTARNPGNTKIQVSAFGQTYEVAISVLAHIESISLNKNDIRLIKTSTNAESIELIANISPANTTDNKTITWSSSDPSVATVNNGIVTSVGPGSCTITAKTSNNKTAVASVFVSVPAETVDILEKDMTLNIGSTKQLTKNITPTNTNDEITWSSSDPSVATVDKNGLVKALGKGQANIILTVGNKSAEVKVTVEVPVTGIQVDVLENETIALYPNQTKTIKANVIPANANIQTITWTIKNNAIAEINNGVIIAKAPGETTLEGVAGSIKVTRKIKVLQNIESYNINIPNATLNANDQESIDLKVTFNPVNTDESQMVTWTINNSNVASIDASGHVIAKSPGTAVVTGTFGNNKTVTSNITVIAPIKEITITNPNIKKEGSNKTLDLINVGTIENLTINYNPEITSSNKDITWTSSNENVATIKNGVITSKGKGSTTITATSANGVTDIVIVTVKIPATSIKINESQTLRIIKGDKKRVTATINPANTSDDTIEWKSQDTNIVSITNDGTITAKNAGQTTIEAKAGNQTDTLKVEVIIPITSFTLKGNNQLDVLKGTTKQIETEINPTDTTEEKTITWTSSNEKVAIVDENGKVTGKSGGTATITGTLQNNMKVTVNVTVSIIPVTNMTIKETELNLLRQEKHPIEVEFDPENTTEKDLLVWSSTDDEIATVENGMVVAKKEGTATIKGVLNNLEVSMLVNVKEIHLESIKVEQTKNTIEIGETTSLNLVLNPIDTTDDLIFTYKSSDESIAVVSSDGTIKGLKKGTTTITITHQSGIETTFDINVIEPENPKTWDSVTNYIILLIGSTISLTLISMKNKKKHRKLK